MPAPFSAPATQGLPRNLFTVIIATAMLVASCSADEPAQPLDLEWPMVDAAADPLLSSAWALPELAVKPPHEGSWAPRPITVDGLSQIASVDGTDVLLHTER